MTNKIQNLKEQVFAVCNRLHENGENCSVRRVLSEIDSHSSTSSIHPYVKEWQQRRLEEIENKTKQFQLSERLLGALVEEAEIMNDKALKHEKDKTSTFELLLEDAEANVQMLQKKLTSSSVQVDDLQTSNVSLKNEVEVMKQAQAAYKQKIDAKSAVLINKYKQELEVTNKVSATQVTELTSLRVANAELRASLSQLEKQLIAQQQQQKSIFDKNQLLQSEKTELAKNVAVLLARVEELEKFNGSIELLQQSFKKHISTKN